MKKALIIISSVLVVVICFRLILFSSDTPGFSRKTHGFQEDRYSRHSDWFQTTHFYENVRVRNAPQDTLARLKLFLQYAHDITAGFETPRTMKNNREENLTSYWIIFYQIRRQENESFGSFLGRRILRNRRRYDEFATVNFGQSWCRDSTKWSLTVIQPVEIFPGSVGNSWIRIFDECPPRNPRPISREDYMLFQRELIEYHRELRNRRKINNRE